MNHRSYRSLHSWFLIGVLILFTVLGNASAAADGRIYVQGNELWANGSRIYLNAANTPWNSWNDFGGSYSSAWWSAEFARLKAKGINSTRIWISCDGTVQPTIDTNGTVTGVTAAFWSNVDDLMSIAQANKIYVMATMMSFDHCRAKKKSQWRAMFESETKVDAMISNYIVPFAVRYKDNPYLYAIDLCNEIEWINQEKESGRLPWSQLQRYVARAAAAIHNSTSTVLVTMGSASAKWNSDVSGYDGNYWKDSELQAQYANDKAFLDFYQLHYYSWMEPWYPLRRSAAQLGLTDRPVVVGELAGKPALENGDRLLPVGETIASISEFFFANGFSGHYPWTSNGIDSNGSLTDFGDAALAFHQAHSSPVSSVATVSTSAATAIGATGASLNGVVNANGSLTTVSFDYGTSTAYGLTVSSTPSSVNGNTATSVSASLTGLRPRTTYHYRVTGGNLGGTSNGIDATFTTLNTPPTAPDATMVGTSGDQKTVTVAFPAIDADGDPVTLTNASSGLNVTVHSFTATTVTVTPLANRAGIGSFTYTVSDGAGGTATGTITVNVTNKPFDIWRFDHFTDAQLTAAPEVNVTTATAATAGMTNLLRFALEPVSGGVASLPQVSRSVDGSLIFSFQRNLQATDIELQVEACSALDKPAADPNSWQPVAIRPAGASDWIPLNGASVSDNNGEVKITERIGTGSMRLFRLKVALP